MSEEATRREYVEPRLQELGSAKDVVCGGGSHVVSDLATSSVA
ncbi:MAG: hypothetical protein WDA71_05550 [Actinomycetota bacterium]